MAIRITQLLVLFGMLAAPVAPVLAPSAAPTAPAAMREIVHVQHTRI